MSDKHTRAVGVVPNVVAHPEVAKIDQRICGKEELDSTERTALLERLVQLADEFPDGCVTDVLVRALERELWRLAADTDSDHLQALIATLNKLQWSYTRMWMETPQDSEFSHVERAERLEHALAEDSFDEEDRVQVVFNLLKGLPFEELDARWDVLDCVYRTQPFMVQFAISYGVCMTATAESRHPVYKAAVQMVGDAAINSNDRSTLCDALIAMRALHNHLNM